ncbi:MAG: glycerophosphodiester phosphodiesterase [Chromatiaceae bacterium]|nr:glycerophosphodiester phosphodiesterase [Chromatiaceae bacterium]
MKSNKGFFAVMALGLAVTAGHTNAGGGADDRGGHGGGWHDSGDADQAVQLGPRPYYLVEGLGEGRLKDRLMQCQDGPFYRTDFSIAHRGAAMQFPEHSDVSYRAGARMGAGLVECDVSFTADGELVCRHSECDLHTTTDIVTTALNAKCTVPWTGPGQSPPPKCCTSDLTLDEFKTLQAKMDASNPGAASAEGYLGGTADWRTNLYTGRAQVLSFRESIALNQALGVKHTPELKGAEHQDRIDAIFGSQEAYAQRFVDELIDGGVHPRDAWVQSFNKDDVLYWIQNNPRFGRQAVFLDSIDPTANPAIERLSFDELKDLRRQGIRIFAPPMWALLSVTDNGRIVPSRYARDIKRAGLEIITWTFERADLRQGAAKGGWYYQFDPQGIAVQNDSDMYLALDVLAREVKILGIFSDWPATVTYYANCMGLR